MEWFYTMLNPEYLIQHGGFWIIILIVFLESGLFFFFLPGDSLLFLAGLFCSSGWIDTTIYELSVFLILSGGLGYMVSYFIGRRFSLIILSGKDFWLLKRKHILHTQEYYKKNHRMSLLIGRFVPVIRTFIPLMAGAFSVKFKEFMLYNWLGSAIWVLGLVLSGYFLGTSFPWLKDYLEYITVIVALIPVMPLIISFFRKWRRKRRDAVPV